MSLHEDVSLFVSSAGAILTGVLGWFLNSPLLGVVSGVFLGAGVSVYVQSRTQRRTWKRELALKNIDTIYAPLYRELNSILMKLDDMLERFAYEVIEYPEWSRISSEYYYHFVADPLKTRLDKFYNDVQTYDQLLTHLSSDVNELIRKEAAVFYNRRDLREISLGIKTGPNPTDFSSIFITNAILFGKDPRKMQYPSYSYISNPEYAVALQVKNQQGGYSMQYLGTPIDMKRFEEFLGKTMAAVRKSSVVVDTNRGVESIASQCKVILASLLRLIQEPWLI